jgi:hypothetical protein
MGLGIAIVVIGEHFPIQAHCGGSDHKATVSGGKDFLVEFFES